MRGHRRIPLVSLRHSPRSRNTKQAQEIRKTLTVLDAREQIVGQRRAGCRARESAACWRAE